MSKTNDDDDDDDDLNFTHV